MNPRDDEYDEEGHEAWLATRDDPKKHAFVKACGSMEGEDKCWLCGNPEIAHAEFARRVHP